MSSIKVNIILEAIELGAKHGPTAVNTIRTILGTWKKDEITDKDWKNLLDGWQKTPKQYLEEARKRNNK